MKTTMKTELTTEEAQAELDGYAAFYAYKDTTDNPHPYCTVIREQWHSGFMRADHEFQLA